MKRTLTKQAEEHRHQHFHGSHEAIREIEERISGHVVAKADGRECDEREVNGLQKVPVLPPWEEGAAKHQVDGDDAQVHDNGHIHLMGRTCCLYVILKYRLPLYLLARCYTQRPFLFCISFVYCFML